MARVYRNTDAHRRTWWRLEDPRTGRSLTLGPGETVELDEDPHDPFLAPTRAPAKVEPVPAKPSEES